VAVEGGGARDKQGCVLVVEDDASMAEFVHDLLAGEGYEVRRREADWPRRRCPSGSPTWLLDLQPAGRPGTNASAPAARFAPVPAAVIVVSGLPQAPAMPPASRRSRLPNRDLAKTALIAQVERIIASRRTGP
jgi:hypothetical protein